MDFRRRSTQRKGEERAGKEETEGETDKRKGNEGEGECTGWI